MLTNGAGSKEQYLADLFNKHYLQLDGCFHENNIIQACTPMEAIIADKIKSANLQETFALVSGYPHVHETFDHK